MAMSKSLVMMLFASICFSASAADLAESTYQGILKLPGQPTDAWTTMDLSSSEITFNVANMAKYSGNITTTETAGKLTLSGTLQPGDCAYTLTSSDGGSSFEGKYTLGSVETDIWLLKVPSELIPATQSTDELADIVGSSDGYTAFIVANSRGNTVCITGDISFDKSAGTWKLASDTQAIQNLLTNMNGPYSIDGPDIYLTSTVGVKLSGKIYDGGNYIKVPMGHALEMEWTLVLIR